MKKSLCLLLSVLMVLIPLAAALTADARASDEATSASYDTEGYRNDQYQQYKRFIREDSVCKNYLADDNAFAYTQAAEKLGDNWYLQAALNSVEFLTNAGWSDLFKGGYDADDVKVQYYVTALSSLLMTMDSNWSDVKQVQSDATSVMTWTDYAADAASVTAGILSVKADGVWETAFDICGLTADALGGSIDTVSDFQALMSFSEAYLRYHDFLKLIERKSDDPLLTRAAQCLVKVTDLCYSYYINYFDTCVDVESKMFFTILDEVLEQEKNRQTLNSDEWVALNGINHLAKSVDYFKLGVDIGKLVCDAFIKSSDLMLRYYEMRAMASVRKALLSELGRLGRKIQGPEDWEEIERTADLLADLNYVNLRGEYCVYRILTKDGGLLSWINVRIKGNKDDWFNSVAETCETVNDLILDLLPSWKYYRIGYDAYDSVIEELTDTYGVFPPAQSGVMIGPESKWLNPTGVMSTSRLDLDSDGAEELLVCTAEQREKNSEQYNIVMRLYDVVNDSVELMDTVILGAYIDPEDKIPVDLYGNAWQEEMIAVHAVKTNGRTYLFCENDETSTAFADGSYTSRWLVEYANGVFRYVCSFTQMGMGSGYLDFTGYDFEYGMCSSRETKYGGDARLADYWQTVREFFGKYGVSLHDNGARESAMDTSEDTQLVFRFKNTLIERRGSTWQDSTYVYRATLETEESADKESAVEENVDKTSANKDLQDAYLRFLETKGYEDYVTDWIHGSPAEYAILDIDADGREELLLTSDTETGFYDFSVLCCDLSSYNAYWLKIRTVWKDDAGGDGISGQYYGTMQYSPEYHALVCAEMNNPRSLFDNYSYLVITDKALVRDFCIGYERSNESEPYSYSIVDYDNASGRDANRVISEAEFDTFMDGCIDIEWLPLP